MVSSGARLSPDGHSVLLQRPDATDKPNVDLWLMNVDRGTLSRFTFDRKPVYAGAWSPDGKQLAIGTVPGQVQIVAANGSGNAKAVTKMELTSANVSDWSRDGQTMLLNAQTSDTGWDIFTLPVSGSEPAPFVHSPFDEVVPRFSPDGKWVAYLSNESGRGEVYVVPFPGPGGRWQVSNGASITGAASALAWSRDGKQIYYRSTDGPLMAADVESKGNELHAGAPRQIFAATTVGSIDTAPDGQILVRVSAEHGEASPITMVLNWDAELK